MSKFKVAKAETPIEKSAPAPKKAARKKEVVSYSLDPDLTEKISRWAWHERKSKSEILEAILIKALEGKEFEPIPNQKPVVIT